MALAMKVLPRRPSSMLLLAFRCPSCPTSTQLRGLSACTPGSLDARSGRWPGGTVRPSTTAQQLSRSSRPLACPTKFACGCHGPRTDHCGRREEATEANNANVGVALAMRLDVLADCLEAAIHVAFGARHPHVAVGARGLASECSIVSSLAVYLASIFQGHERGVSRRTSWAW